MSSVQDFSVFSSPNPYRVALNPSVIPLLAGLQQKASAICSLAKSLEDVAAEGNFTLFSQLPVELRVRIFESAVEDPIIFEVRCHTTDPGDTDSSDPEDYRKIKNRIVHNLPLLGMLHANQESREVVLKRFPVTLSGLSDGTINPDCHAHLDPTRDTVYIPEDMDNCHELGYKPIINSKGSRKFFTAWSALALSTLQHISIDHRIFRSLYNEESGDDIEMNITGFKALRTFTVVLHEGEANPTIHSWNNRVYCMEGWSLYTQEPLALIPHQGSMFAKQAEVDVQNYLIGQEQSIALSERG